MKHIVWETAYGKEYEIQVSDDLSDWSTIEHITDGDGGIDRILTSSDGRYVRMYGIQRGTEWGYSIFEFEIYESRITDVSRDDLEDEKSNQIGYNLDNNYPNPFNPGTTISYSIADHENVEIDIFNVAGEHIISLVNENKEPGSYQVYWDGEDGNKNKVSSGIYIYRLNAGKLSISKKMILLK